jgi:hydrogenase maturation protein HypF
VFDAAAAVMHLVDRNSYEGEAAAKLEALAARQPHGAGMAFPFAATEHDEPWRFDPREALERLAVYRALGMAPETLAARWHDDVAATAVAAALRAMDEHTLAGMQPRTVVLCGGVFQNVRLLHAVRSGLEARGVAVLTARSLPPNDGAISIGQVAIAAATLSLTA